MAKPRNWDALSERQRKRYLSKGKKQGFTDDYTRRYYETGGDLREFRGHRSRYGTSEKTWTKLRRAAYAAKLETDHPKGQTGDAFVVYVLESLLSKGFKPQWILDKLAEKRNSRDTYRSVFAKALRKQFPTSDAGYNPGRKRFHARNQIADLELYYYH